MNAGQQQRTNCTTRDTIHHCVLMMFLLVQVLLFFAGHALIVVSGFGYLSSSPPVPSRYHHLHSLLFSRRSTSRSRGPGGTAPTTTTVPATPSRSSTDEVEHIFGGAVVVDGHHRDDSCYFYEHHPYYGQVLDWLEAAQPEEQEQQQHPISYRILHELPSPFDQVLPLSSSNSSRHMHCFVELQQQGSNSNDNNSNNNNNTTASASSTRSILLHLIPTPTSLEDCLPSHYNQRFTDLLSIASASSLPSLLPLWNKVIHLHEDVWYSKNRIVQQRLLGQVGIYQRRIYARKTTAHKINATYATSFLDTNHLWGATKAKHYYGLFYTNKHAANNEELVAVATFSNKRKVKRGRGGIDEDFTVFQSYELLRFCTQVDTTVVGGLSKLVNKFIQDYQPDDIVTVIDRDWGNGHHGWCRDTSLNFTSVSIMPPLLMMLENGDKNCTYDDAREESRNPPPCSCGRRRRHLVGAGIEIPGGSSSASSTDSAASAIDSATGTSSSSRMGLPLSILTEVESFYSNHTTTATTAADAAEACLDLLATKYNYFPVYDTGVERLFKVIPNDKTSKLLQQPQKSTSTRTATEVLWKQSKPTFTNKYYSNYTFITSLLQYSAGDTQSQNPMDSDSQVAMLKSWKDTQGTAKTAPIVFSTFSSLADSDSSHDGGGSSDAIVEVRQRSNGWRTVGTIEDSQSKSNGSKQRSIYHGVYKVNTTTANDRSSDGNNCVVQPRAVIAEFIKTMASLVLTGIEMALDRNKNSSSISSSSANNSSTLVTTPLRILYYGYGAGVLTRLLADCIDEGEHVAVELDRGVVEAAKIVAIPENVELVVGDALNYTMQYNDSNVEDDDGYYGQFDCVCIDVFDNTLQVPKEFYSYEFLEQLCDNVLRPDGFIVHNFHSGGNKRNSQLEQVDKVYRSVFERRNCLDNDIHNNDIHCCWVDSLDSKSHAGNAIMVATKFPLVVTCRAEAEELPVMGGDEERTEEEEDDTLLRNDLSKYGLISQYRYGLGFDIPTRVVNFRRPNPGGGGIIS